MIGSIILGVLIMAGSNEAAWSNTPGKPLVIIAPPSINNAYYRDRFDDLMKFHTTFAKSVLGNDNILVLVDNATRPYLQGSKPEWFLPADILLEANLEDIWIRDFGTVRQSQPVKLTYQPGYQKKADAKAIDKSFIDFLRKYGIAITPASRNQNVASALNVPWYPDLIVDGGNVVDNKVDKAVMTSRVKEENPQNPFMQSALQTALGYQKLVIVTQYGNRKEDTTGHSDGMVSFIDTNTLAISEIDEPKRSRLWKELQDGFGGEVKLVEVPSYFNEADMTGTGFTSACGVHVNSLVTSDFIYMPTFGQDSSSNRAGYTQAQDDAAYGVISGNTSKRVVKIPVPHKVCGLGGSVRCLSIQLDGPIADQLVMKARGT